MAILLVLTGFLMFITACNACSSDLDCELNGQCVDNKCECNKPWTGEYCQFLDRLPVNPSTQFYRLQPNSTISSWGGNILYDESTQLYHLFYSEMINHCGLKICNIGSYCAHATSTNPMIDEFKFKNIAVAPQAHNCEAHRLSSKYNNQWLLVHDWSGIPVTNNTVPTCCTNITTNGRDNYCNGTTPFENITMVQAPAPPDGYVGGSYLHTADNPDGPWTPVKLPVEGGNPTIWIDDDESLWFLFGSKGLYHGYINSNCTEIVNFTLITKYVQSDWNTSYYVSEDPFLYRDINGYFHIIWHNVSPCNKVDNTYYGDGNPTRGGCGGHSYNIDPRDENNKWYYSDKAAYNSSIVYTNGSVLNIGARERPKLFFMPGEKIPRYLINGVSHHTCTGVNGGNRTCSSKNEYGADNTFTLITPLNA